MQNPDTGEAREALEVTVVGAGQAGLAAAYHLKQRGVCFLVVDPAPAWLVDRSTRQPGSSLHKRARSKRAADTPTRSLSTRMNRVEMPS